MNTADRSLALVDYALRRRFRFVSLTPQFQSPKFKTLLRKFGASQELVDQLVGKLSETNGRIREDMRELGVSYEIGHSYFVPPDKSDITLNKDWYNSIIKLEVAPLLEEYWFDNINKAKEATTALFI
jgi:5-methylcytosine-specific restriction protein B